MSAQTPLANQLPLPKFINLTKYFIPPFHALPNYQIIEYQKEEFLASQQFDQMDKNIESINPGIQQVKTEMNQTSESIDKSHFFQRIQRFLQPISQSKAFKLHYFSKGFRIILTNAQESIKELETIASDIFDKSLKDLEAQFQKFCISITKKKLNNEGFIKMTFRFKEPIAFGSDQARVEEQSSNQQQIADEFPKDEQLQQIIKSKGDLMKGAFNKQSLLISKTKSQGMIGSMIKKRNADENSLEVQLYQQDLFSTPSGINRKNTSTLRQSQEEVQQAFQQKSNQYKQNYEKCSKLIDSTMMEILTAHRQRKIGDKADEILNKVIEIYDILSDNIENVNSIVKDFDVRAQEKKENKATSPGFKPLN